MKLEQPSASTPCPAAKKPEVYASACLGLLDDKKKQKLWHHCVEECDECMQLWLEVTELIQQLKITELVSCMKALEDKKQQAQLALNAEIQEIRQICTQTEQRVSKLEESQNQVYQISKETVKGLDKLTFFMIVLSLLVAAFITVAVYDKLNLPKEVNNYTLPTFINSQNLYQQLDSFIDQYLLTRNIKYLDQADTVAYQIALKGDQFGVGLVKYYRTAPDNFLNDLAEYRKEMNLLVNLPNGDQYASRLEKARTLHTGFISTSNVLEAYKVNTLIAKLEAKLFNHEKANIIIDEGLAFARSNKYLILQVEFLTWRAKILTLRGKPENAISALQEVIALGEKLSLEEITITATMSLAGTYQNNNEDRKNLELTSSMLSKNIINLEFRVAFNQTAGLSAYKLGYQDLAYSYLREALRLAETTNNNALLSSCYTTLGLIETTAKRFDQASLAYQSAIENALKIQDKNPRNYALSIVRGQQAKTALTLGNYQDAARLYDETLALMDNLEIKLNLQMAELNDGLAIALKNLGQQDRAKSYKVAAEQYLVLARHANEQQNCIMSFLPSACELFNN